MLLCYDKNYYKDKQRDKKKKEEKRGYNIHSFFLLLLWKGEWKKRHCK